VSSPLIDQLAALADLPDVRAKSDAAREACTRLRFHEALRRRIPEASAESRVRGAHASAGLDGAQLPLDTIRRLMSGAQEWPADPDPGVQVVRGAVAATAESERVVSLVRSAPLQALARLHVAAMGHLLEADKVGRPRVAGETCEEFVDLGPAPSHDVVASRLAHLSEVVVAGAEAANRVPAVVVAALVHAEIAHLRPFARGNGLVARAMERALIQALGLDPTGVAVPEAGHVANGGPAYLGALAAYGQGSAAGVGLWLTQSADALVAGAAEGERICDAVRAGRLG
jgi:Fic family protein